VIGNFFGALAVVLNIVLNALMLIILINALLSWIRPDPSNPAVQFLDRVSDVVCNPIRRLFPTVFGGFDLAPMIAMLVLIFLQRWLVPTLAGL
jgi:YggT family protein